MEEINRPFSQQPLWFELFGWAQVFPMAQWLNSTTLNENFYQIYLQYCTHSKFIVTKAPFWTKKCYKREKKKMNSIKLNKLHYTQCWTESHATFAFVCSKIQNYDWKLYRPLLSSHVLTFSRESFWNCIHYSLIFLTACEICSSA